MVSERDYVYVYTCIKPQNGIERNGQQPEYV